MGKVIAREFIWLIVTIIISLPLGMLFLWFFGYTREAVNLDETSKNYIFWMYLLGYFVSFACIYIMRFVAMSIIAMTSPAAEASED